MFFHHGEQCCYPSFPCIPHIPAMTSHVAYVIYAIFTIITTQGLCNITIFLMTFLFLYAFGTTSLYDSYFSCSLISMSPYSLCIGSGIKSIRALVTALD